MASEKKKNTLITIGWLSSKSAYLNVPRHEAERRYREANDMAQDEPLPSVTVFEFDDEFNVYEAWGP